MTRTFPKFGYNPVTGEWNDSLAGEYLWSNVNVNEAVPDVMTPSTWSLWWIYHFEVSPFEFPGDHPMCGNICGRPYLNLGLLLSIYRALGRDVRKEMQGDMIGSAPAELDIPLIPFSPLAVLWKGLPAMFKLRQDARRDTQTDAGISERNARVVPDHAHADPGLYGCSRSALAVDDSHQAHHCPRLPDAAQRNHDPGRPCHQTAPGLDRPGRRNRGQHALIQPFRRLRRSGKPRPAGGTGEGAEGRDEPRTIPGTLRASRSARNGVVRPRFRR